MASSGNKGPMGNLIDKLRSLIGQHDPQKTKIVCTFGPASKTWPLQMAPTHE